MRKWLEGELCKGFLFLNEISWGLVCCFWGFCRSCEEVSGSKAVGQVGGQVFGSSGLGGSGGVELGAIAVIGVDVWPLGFRWVKGQRWLG